MNYADYYRSSRFNNSGSSGSMMAPPSSGLPSPSSRPAPLMPYPSMSTSNIAPRNRTAQPRNAMPYVPRRPSTAQMNASMAGNMMSGGGYSGAPVKPMSGYQEWLKRQPGYIYFLNGTHSNPGMFDESAYLASLNQNNATRGYQRPTYGPGISYGEDGLVPLVTKSSRVDYSGTF